MSVLQEDEFIFCYDRVLEILKPVKNISSYLQESLDKLENEGIAYEKYDSGHKLVLYTLYNRFLYEEENSDTIHYYENHNIFFKKSFKEYRYRNEKEKVLWCRHSSPTSMGVSINKKAKYFPYKDSFLIDICKDVAVCTEEEINRAKDIITLNFNSKWDCWE